MSTLEFFDADLDWRKFSESRILERNVVCLPRSRRYVAERSSVTFKLPTYYSRGILTEANENDIESKIAVFQDPKLWEVNWTWSVATMMGEKEAEWIKMYKKRMFFLLPHVKKYKKI